MGGIGKQRLTSAEDSADNFDADQQEIGGESDPGDFEAAGQTGLGCCFGGLDIM
jgi:hypothetical protein